MKPHLRSFGGSDGGSCPLFPRGLNQPLGTHARYTRDKPRLGDTLEIIKFVCKDFWQALFKKQVDNLKTNHRVRSMALGEAGDN